MSGKAGHRAIPQWRGREQWMDRALCREVDPDLFFPEKPGSSIREAKSICDRCPVREQCLAYALREFTTTTDYGVWGGLSVKDRKRLRAALGYTEPPVTGDSPLCVNGHSRDEYYNPVRRRCRECQRESQRRYEASRRRVRGKTA